jgi:glycosyltransferase involved in cell wall biosynthesis
VADRAARLRILLEALDQDGSGQLPALLERAAARYADPSEPEVWLALAVLSARLPTAREVVSARRSLHLEPAKDVLERMFARAGRGDVQVVRGAVVVDVHHTARTRLATGIQRVVRETIRRWAQTQELTLVGWTGQGDALRLLPPAEAENAKYGTQPHARKPRSRSVVVPWQSTYLLAELATDERRTLRISALAEFSGNRTGTIGYDCVPLTSADTIGAGMGSAFVRYLSAIARMDAVGAISVASAIEYTGWRDMLPSAGLRGPAIGEIMLPHEVGAATEAEVADAIALRRSPDLPLVLCVGSHEPRKNHLSVVQAAELLWAKGREFEVLFIGGNSWDSESFESELHRLQRGGAPIGTVSGVADGVLWAAYRLAGVTVFPSFNEGFGLPVAESLASGTPVVTSDFGSMRELGQDGGALLIDPRDDDALADAIESVLFEPGVAERLRAEAERRPARTWDEYASELWAYFRDA